jgi:hypothetical protein
MNDVYVVSLRRFKVKSELRMKLPKMCALFSLKSSLSELSLRSSVNVRAVVDPEFGC